MNKTTILILVIFGTSITELKASDTISHTPDDICKVYEYFSSIKGKGEFETTEEYTKRYYSSVDTKPYYTFKLEEVKLT